MLNDTACLCSKQNQCKYLTINFMYLLLSLSIFSVFGNLISTVKVPCCVSPGTPWEQNYLTNTGGIPLFFILFYFMTLSQYWPSRSADMQRAVQQTHSNRTENVLAYPPAKQFSVKWLGAMLKSGYPALIMHLCSCLFCYCNSLLTNSWSAVRKYTHISTSNQNVWDLTHQMRY